MPTELLAPAKINLSLHVTGRRADGYHLLDSLVCFVDCADVITIEESIATELSVDGPHAQDGLNSDDNLMVRAANLMGVPLKMKLAKNLPVSSGIGGGSADAAAIIRGAVSLGAQVPTLDQMLTLGADIPVCVESTPARMQGTGERLTPLSLPQLHMVLVNPMKAVSTPQVFAALEQTENAPMPAFPDWPDAVALADWLGRCRNDLQKPAVQICPEIAAALTAIALSDQVLLARMSGSGATCFGLYETRAEADAAAQTLSRLNPDWWVVSTSTIEAPAEGSSP